MGPRAEGRANEQDPGGRRRPPPPSLGFMHERIATTAARGFWHRLAGLIITAFDAILAWQDRSVARRSLRAMDERMLKDAGFNRCDAEGEGRKPFWRA